MKPSIETKIEVPSDLQAINLVLFQYNQIYHNTIPQQDWLQCQLALVEGFTNAVRHAHKNLPEETPITIAIAIDRQRMIIRIWDYGQPFNLKSFIRTMSQRNRSWEGSGRGIAIMHKIADSLSYKRISGHQNCLKIVKYFRYRSA